MLENIRNKNKNNIMAQNGGRPEKQITVFNYKCDGIIKKE